jgi:hypothetical protein
MRGTLDGVKKGIPIPPAFAVLADDPRYHEIEVAMLNNMNRDREIVGLPPLNANYEAEPLRELTE